MFIGFVKFIIKSMTNFVFGLAKSGAFSKRYIDLNTVTILARNLHCSIQNGKLQRRTGKILLGELNIICPNETCCLQMHKMILS